MFPGKENEAMENYFTMETQKYRGFKAINLLNKQSDQILFQYNLTWGR